ncbi:ankyrin repeat domain-containing protein [Streptomyces halobius]|uniref:Ankyrin repeat domain-containing protein n=1 Tax=Streptomyces halobius TaxID=2879846 RepID=A0ABY4MK56_9ACTN|nr:ankyrin repeat domain-containing protein [Streptomyces halobius]UQA98179.1 ankyrin repeat domain-containing protein [Streptomyces halobius]
MHIDATDSWNRRPLLQAVAGGKIAAVGHLLAHGADADQGDAEHRTALELCRRHHRAGSLVRARLEALLAPVAGTDGSATRPDQ